MKTMKKMKKIFAFMLALAMMLSLTGIVNAGKASAADLSEGTEGAAKTITITSPGNAQSSDTFKYTIYKVFDATSDGASDGISYKLLDGVTDAPTGFTVDDAGNVYLGTLSDTEVAGATKITIGGVDKYLTPQTADLTADQIKAISDYTSKTEVGTTTITGANTKKTVTVPDYGYYFITTTTGSIVTINSTHPAASVQDKNKVPKLDKDIANVAGVDGTGANNENGETATAKIGDTVNYTVNITAYKGAENYVYHDILSAGLTLVADTEPVVSVGGTNLTKDTDYTLTKFDNNATNGTDDNITITFKKSYLDTVTDDTVINITYSAILNEGAVIAGAGNPNTAKLDYGKEGFVNSTPEDKPVVYTYEFQLVKDNSSKEILTGAEFELYASDKTTKLNLVKNAEGNYLIKSSTDTTNTAVDKIEAGTPKIIGLANGTYYLKEIKAPTGYNCLNEMIEVVINSDNNNATIADNKYTSGGIEVVNKSGSALPSTGGIGTTIFYVLGGILMAAAVVLLITKKKMSAYRN